MDTNFRKCKDLKFIFVGTNFREFLVWRYSVVQIFANILVFIILWYKFSRNMEINFFLSNEILVKCKLTRTKNQNSFQKDNSNGNAAF